jgi:HIRAN domain
MASILPGAPAFRTPVYGTVFGRRTQVVHRLHPGDRLILVPDPPGADPPNVWVHARGGDVVGHLSPDVNAWLAPLMLSGSCYGAEVAEVRGDDVASWKRLVIDVRCVRGNAAKSA